MRIVIDLDTASSIALRRLANELRCTEEDAATRALREALIGSGLLELEYSDDPEGQNNCG
jgi:hypothetical protein